MFDSGNASGVGEEAHLLELGCGTPLLMWNAVLFNSSFTLESHFVEHREVSGESRMPTPKYAAYKAADPYFSWSDVHWVSLWRASTSLTPSATTPSTRSYMISAGHASFADEPT